MSQRRQLQAVMTSASGPVLHTCGATSSMLLARQRNSAASADHADLTHAGIVTTTVYELCEPTIPPDPAVRIVS